jgi:hypothetical protein
MDPGRWVWTERAPHHSTRALAREATCASPLVGEVGSGGGRPRAVVGDRQPPRRGLVGIGPHTVDPPRRAARTPPPAGAGSLAKPPSAGKMNGGTGSDEGPD